MPFSSDVATCVYGQEDFSASESGKGRAQLDSPESATVTARGMLLVADCGNRRLVGWRQAHTRQSGAEADVVLALDVYPLCVRVDSQGDLWVGSDEHVIKRFAAADELHDDEPVQILVVQ